RSRSRVRGTGRRAFTTEMLDVRGGRHKRPEDAGPIRDRQGAAGGHPVPARVARGLTAPTGQPAASPDASRARLGGRVPRWVPGRAPSAAASAAVLRTGLERRLAGLLGDLLVGVQ